MTQRLLALAVVLSLGACQFHQASRTERTAVQTTLKQFHKAFNLRSFAALEPVLSPDFHFDGLPPGMSLDGLRASLPAVEMRMTDVQLLSLRRQGDGFAARVGLYFSNGAAEAGMGFAPSGKIRAITFGSGRPAPPVPAPDVVTSRFVESRGLMFIRVKVDGRAGFFLVDSGSSEMLMNAKYYSAAMPQELFPISAGIHGMKKPLGGMRIGIFQWENWRISDVNATVRDLANLERPENTPLLGAIGHAQFKNAALVVDWERQQIQVFATSKNGMRKVEDRVTPKAVVPFSYELHLPALPARIGPRNFVMLFDSGASGNLLPDVENLAGHFQRMGTQGELSDGGVRRRIDAPFGRVDEVVLGDLSLLNLPVIIHGIPYLHGRGLLGAPLFSRGRVEINFRSRQMRFWDQEAR